MGKRSKEYFLGYGLFGRLGLQNPSTLLYKEFMYSMSHKGRDTFSMKYFAES